MSDPRRFVDDETGSSGKLLRSARADVVPAEARQRAIGALGLGAGATVTTSAASAIGGSATGKASLLGWSVKVALGGALLLGLTATTIHHVRASHATTKAASLAASALKSAANAPKIEDQQQASVAPPEPASSIELAPAPARPAIVAAPRSVSSGSGATWDLAAEIAQLDQAREALASGQTERALAIVRDYEHNPSSKTLLLEAQVLHIEALAQRGDGTHAAQLARAFLAEHPTSAHAAHVRSLLLTSEKLGAP